MLPDLLETMNSVLAGSILLLDRSESAPGRWSRAPESSGQPVWRPNVSRKHFRPEARSAHAEQNDVGEAALLSSPRQSSISRSASRCSRSTMSSQPSHLASSAPVQSAASPAQSRRTLPARAAKLPSRRRQAASQAREELGTSGCRASRRELRALVAPPRRAACRRHRRTAARLPRPASPSPASIEMPMALQLGHRLLGFVDILLEASRRTFP